LYEIEGLREDEAVSYIEQLRGEEPEREEAPESREYPSGYFSNLRQRRIRNALQVL